MSEVSLLIASRYAVINDFMVLIEKLSDNKELKVIFVLGGPGSGKGSQCANIVKHFGFTHISVGDLLRAEVRSGSENGAMIERIINEGQLVSSEITIKLLQRALHGSRNDKFLIDGFPRNEENRVAFENITKIEPEFVLFFDCPEEEMERRILNRKQGRDDDNMETVRKRLKVFMESTLPVIEFYGLKGKLYKIDACKPADEVFEEVKDIFSIFRAKEVSFQETNISATYKGFELLVCLIKRLFREIKKMCTSYFCQALQRCLEK